jgi:TRAP-type C4-dicarboxylate transport system permease large subunit
MAGGTLGIVIPPSIPMIVYGLVTETSITELFKAGVGRGCCSGGDVGLCDVGHRHMPHAALRLG